MGEIKSLPSKQGTQLPARKPPTAIQKPQPRAPSLPKVDAVELRKRYPEVAKIEDDQARLQAIISILLVPGVDYGTIPGVPKPFPFKGAAEVIRLHFGFSIRYDIESNIDLDKQLFMYTVTTSVFNKDGAYIGMGVGSCNSLESKYRYRWAYWNQVSDELLPPESKANWETATKYWENTYGKEAIRIKRGMPPQLRVLNTNPADQANTYLKIGKKRSFMDAIFTVTGASRHFMMSDDQVDGILQEVEEPEAIDVETGEIPTTAPAPSPFDNKMLDLCVALGWTDEAGKGNLSAIIEMNWPGKKNPNDLTDQEKPVLLTILAERLNKQPKI